MGNTPAYPIPLGPGVRLLKCHDCGLVALEKPAGILSVPNKPGEEKRSLLHAKFSKKEEAFVWYDSDQIRRYFYVCHRLDAPTSGVILGATDQNATDQLKLLFKQKRVWKSYVALVGSVPHRSSGSWKDLLLKKGGGNQVRSVIDKRGQEAVTDWTLLGKNQNTGVALLALNPKTGRTHQLRVQCASRKLEIIGDRTYGDFKKNAQYKKTLGLDRLMLHAHRIEITLPIESNPSLDFTATSELPVEFTQQIDKLEGRMSGNL